jgi:hypothetical protein
MQAESPLQQLNPNACVYKEPANEKKASVY